MSTRRALALSFADRYAGLALAIVSSVLIARLLKPEEIGAFSVVMVLVSLVTALRDFGAGQYLLQEKDLTPARIQATWSVLAATGGFFGLVVALAAWPVARFYADERIVDIMLVLSLSFIINPVASLSYAWLMREMRFDALAVMRLGAGVAGAVVSVGLAWLGHGPISMALGTLSATAVNALIAMWWRPATFRWRLDFAEARRVMGFGGRISATAFVTNVGNGVPELVLGKVQGLADAAYYSRAFGLAGMFQKLVLDAAQSVAMPLFAKSMRETGSVEQPLILSIGYACALGWSFFFCLALLANPVIVLLYGRQWLDAVELTRWLAIAMAIGLPASMVPVALNASGRVDVTMATTIRVVGMQAALISAAAVHGLPSIGPAVAGGQVLACWMWWRAARGTTIQDRTQVARTMTQSLIVGFAAAAPSLATSMKMGWEPQSPATAVAIAGVGGTISMVLAVLLVGHPIRRELWSIAARIAQTVNGDPKRKL